MTGVVMVVKNGKIPNGRKNNEFFLSQLYFWYGRVSKYWFYLYIFHLYLNKTKNLLKRVLNHQKLIASRDGAGSIQTLYWVRSALICLYFELFLLWIGQSIKTLVLSKQFSSILKHKTSLKISNRVSNLPKTMVYKVSACWSHFGTYSTLASTSKGLCPLYLVAG